MRRIAHHPGRRSISPSKDISLRGVGVGHINNLRMGWLGMLAGGSGRWVLEQMAGWSG